MKPRPVESLRKGLSGPKRTLS